MMKKVLVPFVAIVVGFGLFAACSNDSDSANSQVSGPVNSTVAKVESASFTAENQSNCGMEVGLMKSESETDSVHLYMNKDGSAVLKEKMQSICRYKGETSNISLEKSGDTLLVSIDYYEYPPDTVVVSAVLNEKMQSIIRDKGNKISNISVEKSNDTMLVSIDYYEYPPDTVVVYNDSLGKNDTLIMSRYPTPKCGGICSADYEIDVPAEFVGSKFVSVIRNGKALLYPIAYVKE
jgi:hypothetical protein